MDQLKLVWEHVDRQIDLADRKAQLILAANTFMAATLASLGSGIGLRLFDPAAPVIQRLAALGTLVLIGALLLSVYHALMVARPRMAVANARRTLLYAGHIVQWSEEEFIGSFHDQTNQDLQDAILAQVYSRAHIATRKLVGIRRSLDFLLVAFSAWAVVRILLVFTPGQ